ncbi:MAG: IS3 family transposase [Methylobacterium sp.]|nr:IS3 family transposase [Methylobacterium sp.]MCA3661189.1 IS3 family transposase [Methylobacterium sp.]MCA3663973.1 IS3 family transposase [Methylobacterium sp.]MCA3666979.1 IS3 family transposase [Methylobacterium sp.]MCA3669420.1 IS3 family transposase [Methylobacterium sp.]
MGKANFTEDFKRDAVLPITERGYPVAEVAARPGISKYSLHEWKKRYAKPAAAARDDDQAAEVRRLKRELQRVTEERDILKKRGRVLRQGCKVKYAFIAEHRPIFSIRAMCRCLSVQPSGFYAWLKDPLSRRAKEDERQTELIRAAWRDSGKVYGYRKLHDDLADMGESCCPNRVARLSRLAGIRAQIGYKRRPGHYGGKPSLAVDNTLDRRFDMEAPDKAWVTDITYIRTHEGFAYLAVVLDLFSRRVVGWSIQARQTTNVVLQALLAAVWRRKPKGRVLVHSDQGSQFTSLEWASFLKHHDLEPSMSRRGSCHDNTVAESFFNLLKRERVRRKVYRTRDEARADVFDDIEMFYNPIRKHARNGMLSPIEFERKHKVKAEGV